MSSQLGIDVFFDLICPWCLIGKHQLRRALARLEETDPDVRARVHWHSVQLIPDVPDHGLPFAEFYEHRLGSKEAVHARQMQVTVAAAQAGAAIDFSRITTFPNTARAHRLLVFGKQHLDPVSHDRLLDRLFAAYFERGEDLGNLRNLVAIAAEHGLEPEATRAALGNRANVFESPAIPGVPYFVFNRRSALSGAHPSEVLHAAMREAIERSEHAAAQPGSA